jgi:hypothetical protein
MCRRGKKVNLSQCLISYALRYEDVWRSGVIAPPFPTSAVIGGEWSAPRLYRFPLVKEPPVTHWLGWAPGRCRRFGEVKNVALPGIEARPSSPALHRLRHPDAFTWRCSKGINYKANLRYSEKPQEALNLLVTEERY